MELPGVPPGTKQIHNDYLFLTMGRDNTEQTLKSSHIELTEILFSLIKIHPSGSVYPRITAPLTTVLLVISIWKEIYTTYQMYSSYLTSEMEGRVEMETKKTVVVQRAHDFAADKQFLHRWTE